MSTKKLSKRARQILIKYLIPHAGKIFLNPEEIVSSLRDDELIRISKSAKAYNRG